MEIDNNNKQILVDGGYTDFGDWSECSASCGEGTETRTRTCTSPAPAHGGADCVGESTETRPCKLADCPGYRYFMLSFLSFRHFLHISESFAQINQNS